MKSLILVSALVFSSLAMAGETISEEASYAARNGRPWSCWATGLDPRTHQNVSVPGDDKPTLEEAQQSAIMNCVSMGYMACSYSTCMNL